MRNSLFRNISRKYLRRFIVLAILLLIGHKALASGFKLPVQNVTNMGVAYAGTAALAIDASTNFYNPAGLVRLNEEQLVLGGIINLPYTRVDITRATSTFGPAVTPAPARAVPQNSSLVPVFHYAQRINNDWVFGFSTVTAFGTRTNYLPTSIVRYMATRSELVTIDFAPSLAYCFGNGFSVGAGVNALYARARLESMIGAGDLDTDGRFRVKAENWGYGAHAGILYEFTDCTRVGLNYHSNIDVNAKGVALTQLSAASPISVENLRTKLHLPEFWALSAYHAFDEQFAIMADLQWVRWDRFRQVVLNFGDGSQIITSPNYRNAYFVAIGGTYQLNDCWQLKIGAAFDKTATVDGSRPLYNPDQDQVYAAVGAQYRVNKCLALELGYVHVFYKQANINLGPPTSVGRPQGLQSVDGTSRSNIEVFGLQVTWDLV